MAETACGEHMFKVQAINFLAELCVEVNRCEGIFQDVLPTITKVQSPCMSCSLWLEDGTGPGLGPLLFIHEVQPCSPTKSAHTLTGAPVRQPVEYLRGDFFPRLNCQRSAICFT